MAAIERIGMEKRNSLGMEHVCSRCIGTVRGLRGFPPMTDLKGPKPSVGDWHLRTDAEGVSHQRPRLYRLDPRDGSLRVVADDIEGPNGLCFSPEERLLDTRGLARVSGGRIG